MLGGVWFCRINSKTVKVFFLNVTLSALPMWTPYLITAVSLLWLPFLRPLGDFYQSSLTSPRQPYPRRSPYNPWLQTLGRTDHLRKKKASMPMVSLSPDAENNDRAALASSAAFQRADARYLYPRVKYSVSLRFCSTTSSKMKQTHPNS